MAFLTCVLLLPCVLSLSSLGSAISIPADHGYMKNCGPPAMNFTFYWTPEYIIITHQTTVYANFTPHMDWSSGRACCVGTVPTCPVPVYEQCADFSCEDVDKIQEGICPFKKGKNINMMAGTTYTIQPNWPIPEDNYTFTCNVTNQNGELFLCAKGPVKVKDPTYLFKPVKTASKIHHLDKLLRSQPAVSAVHNMDQPDWKDSLYLRGKQIVAGEHNIKQTDNQNFLSPQEEELAAEDN